MSKYKIKHKRYELHVLFNYLKKNNYTYEKLKYSEYKKAMTAVFDSEAIFDAYDKTKNIWRITPRMDTLPLCLWLWSFGRKEEGRFYIYSSMNLKDCTIIKYNTNYNYYYPDPNDYVSIADEFSMEEASSDPDLFEHWSEEVANRESSTIEDAFDYEDYLSHDEKIRNQIDANIKNIDDEKFSSLYDIEIYFGKKLNNGKEIKSLKDVHINSLPLDVIEKIKDLDKNTFDNSWSVSKRKRDGAYLFYISDYENFGTSSETESYFIDSKIFDYSKKYPEGSGAFPNIYLSDNPKIKFKNLNNTKITHSTFKTNFKIKIDDEYEGDLIKLLSSVDHKFAKSELDRYEKLNKDTGFHDYSDEYRMDAKFFQNLGFEKIPFTIISRQLKK